MWEYFRAQDWGALSGLVADDELIDDRRRVVNGGVRHGRYAGIQELQAAADIGFAIKMVDVKATRGDRLALTRVRASGRDPGAIQNDVLQVVEIDADERIAGVITFDVADIDAALEELENRYLICEAAVYARAWSVIMASYAAINRHEQPATTADWVDVDHRREIAMRPGDLAAYFEAGSDPNQNITTYVENVQRLNSVGAVVIYAAQETSREGFNAEWRGVALLTVDGDMVNRSEVFDEADLDAAMARFDRLSQPAPRLENTATRVFERLYSHVAAGEWHAVTQITAENVSVDDRRRVVNAGILHGRDANIKDAKATVDVGFTMTMSGVLATRGGRLALTGIRVSGRDPEAIQNDALQIMEVDAEERIAGVVVFDLEDFDAAIAELDARYVAGEAAAHTRTWSVIAGVFVAHNRREVAATTPDVVSIDHRRVAAFAPGEGFEYIRAGWELDQSLNIYIEAAHRLSDLGALFTWAGHGTSHEGFEAEWRGVTLMTVDGEMVSRMEVFDEGELDAALAKFDQLSRPTPRLENAAAQSYERLQAHFAARDWDAMAEALADEAFHDDRRRVVGGGLRRGRDAVVAEFSALAEIGVKRITFDVIATRGDRLVLTRSRASGRDPRADAFRTDVLNIAEFDADERTVALITFDPDDFDAAIAELDARYLAGEAAAHAHTWSVVAQAYDALKRRVFPATAPECVNIDHRGETAFGPDNLVAYLRAGLDFPQDFNIYIEAVRRLTDLGVIITYAAHEISQAGCSAEWRGVTILTVEGDLINRSEVFDEAEFDAALARFDELSRPVPRLENAASQAYEHFRTYFAARDWAAMAELLTADTSVDDHRRVVNAETRRGRDIEIANMRAFADIGAKTSTATIIATRGERLVLCRTCISGEDHPVGEFRIELLIIVETTADRRILARIAYDPDDIHAAIAELDARYLAGEAAAHARTWSVISRGNAAANRNATLPMTPDASMIDHRLRTTLNADGLAAYIRATWDLTPELHMFIESVHRLNDVGMVVTHASRGTSQDDFEAEWRQITLFTVDGDLCNRCEIFDEEDLDTALARFDELCPPTPRLENTASQVAERFLRHFAVSDWDAMAEILADNFFNDDRRPLVSFGVQHGRDAQIANMRAIAELLSTDVTSTVVATRAARLALVRLGFSVRGQGPDAFQIEALGVVGIDTEDRIAAFVVFDPDDFDAALAELDARYLAGEAAIHAHTWSLVMHVQAAYNRHEVLPATADWANIDHRRGRAFTAGDTVPYLRATYDVAPNVKGHIEAVHQLTNLGVVVTAIVTGTSQEGFDAEWREVALFAFEGDMVCRFEIFDEADLDTALARFNELQPQARRLENAATRTVEQFFAHFEVRDWDAMAELLADDVSADDRRSVVNAGIRRGRDLEMANWRATADLWTISVRSTVATRGERLALVRFMFTRKDGGLQAFSVAALAVIEINDSNRIAEIVAIEADDIDAAFEELETRYLAGEAAAHAQTWSLIARAYAALNRGEIPATAPHVVDVDHRSLAAIGSGDMIPYVRAALEDMALSRIYAEAVHRLSDLGAVVSHAADGTTPEGFDAEWRHVQLLTFEGDRINRCEIFDAADLDAALARFDELES
jgi:hypothetical protein